jgi:hypothetical protein
MAPAEYPQAMIMRPLTLSISLLSFFGPVGARADDSSVRAALQAQYMEPSVAASNVPSRSSVQLLGGLAHEKVGSLRA